MMIAFSTPALADAATCLQEIKARHPGEVLLTYDSQADLMQKVVGPLRRNKLSQAQADETRPN